MRTDLANLGVEHDVFFSEKTLHGQGGDIDLTLDWLRQEGLVYQGRLDRPKGAPDEDWEDREQTLFRATRYGDDVDRPLVKSDGSYTYFAADIAYHRKKYLRGFTAHDQCAGRRSLGLCQPAQGSGESGVAAAKPIWTSRSCSSSG